MTSPVDATVGNIRIERTLSDRADGLLLLGSQPSLDRLVAVRRIPADLPDDSEVAQRFRREARLGARVHHPNVIGVIDCFEDRGERYLVREYVDGPDLEKLMAHAGRTPIRVAIAIGTEIARGLQELHARGIVLGSLCPRRVLVSRWGTPRFRGLAWARELGEESPPAVPPSPYRAPELDRLEAGDPRSDVYALGGLLYEMLTDLAPRPGARLPWRHAAPRLARVIARCLRPDPDDRPESADALRLALEHLTRRPSPGECRGQIAEWIYASGALDAPADARPQRSVEAEQPWPPVSRWRWAAAGGAAAALVGAVLSSFWTGGDGRPRSNGGARSSTPPVSAGPEVMRQTASVRLVVHPWAEVQIDGGAPFLTPRAEPLELDAGEHEFVLRHPGFGTVTRQVRLEPGEDRVIKESLLPEEAS
jgi:serine/threonine-protein kinase